MINNIKMMKKRLENEMLRIFNKKEYAKAVTSLLLEYDNDKLISFQVKEWLKNDIFCSEISLEIESFLSKEEKISTGELIEIIDSYLNSDIFEKEYKDIQDVLNKALKDIDRIYNKEKVDKIINQLEDVGNKARISGSKLLKAFSEALEPKEKEDKK